MTNATSNSFAQFMRAWTPPALAPDSLMQSINGGWSFGNVTINAQNSSAPATEQAIVAQDSYGRQIGKLLDAVSALVEARPDATSNAAFMELAALRTRIDAVKRDAALHHVDRLRHDLELLRASPDAEHRAAYRRQVAALRDLLRDQPD